MRGPLARKSSGFPRRGFLQLGAATGAVLAVGFRWDTALAQEEKPAAPPPPNPFAAWIKIAKDGSVGLVVAKSEMGQGIYTALPMIVADELDVDFAKVKIEQAETNAAWYDHGTGGSSSVRTQYTPLRQIGAAARGLLVTAAANRWKVDPKTLTTESGFVLGPAGQKVAYGDLVEEAAKLPLPDLKTVALKDPAKFKVIGTQIQRQDVPSKTNGTAPYGIDVRRPGMLHAVVARPPVYGGSVKRYDATKTKAVPGVTAVVDLPKVDTDGAYTRGGVAVVATSSWAAMKGREALDIEFDGGALASFGNESLRRDFEAKIAKGGKVVRHEGDADKAVAADAKALKAVYEIPFQVHAPMEPLNATADVKPDKIEIWMGCQGPQWPQGVIAKALGYKEDQVTVHTTFLGGAFGRRYACDFGLEAAQVSKAVGKPVQVLWTREDDTRHGFYRPYSLHHVSAALDASGAPKAWTHRMASTPISTFWDDPAKVKPEDSEIGGAVNLPYAVPAFHMEYSDQPRGFPTMWWRSVEHSGNAFVTESFIDELAAAANADPLAYRLKLLTPPREVKFPPQGEGSALDTKKLVAVLELAASKAGWGKPLPKGRFRGIAGHFSFESYAAQVAEVSVTNGRVRVHKMVCAIDCGRAISPDNVKAQMESCIVYGLTATLKSAITVKDGKVEQSNFHDYPMLRIDETPEIEVHIVPSDGAPTGTGEPGLPPVAPAVANAIFAATGKRIRHLPITEKDFA